MNIARRIYCRIYQKLMFLAGGLIKYREPILIKGRNSITEIAPIVKGKRVLMLVTPSLIRRNLLDGLLKEFEHDGIEYFIYSDIVSNPTFTSIYKCAEFARVNSTNAIVAIGGGSALDTAKAVICLLTSDGNDLSKFKGLLRVKRKYPLFIAVPTTAGSGSEVTVASVVTNDGNGDKFAINDPKLIPDYAVLDPVLLKSLPKHVVATTGMDALTHAVESYIGHSNYKKTAIWAKTAVSLIAENLLKFYEDSNNEQAILNMQYGAYLAGEAFTKSYVGYVHALAHSLGGKYNIPHGEANAILLPYVLEAYGKKADKRLEELDEIVQTCSNNGNLCTSSHFIEWIKELNDTMCVGNRLHDIIKIDDLDELAKHADKEANPLYPVPKELDKEELKAIYLRVMK